MAATVARYGSGSNNVTLTISSGPSGSSTNNYRPPPAGGSVSNADYQLFNRPGYRFKSNQRAQEELAMGDGPGRRLRKNVANVRRHVDYIATILNHVEGRLWQYNRRHRLCQQPDVLYQNSPLPPYCTPDVPVDCILTKFVRAAMNKVKCPVYSLCWTPEGKRLVTGASTGEFTLWNGTAFNFETILQAHDSAIRAMTWSHNEQWLVSADSDGFIKYWQPNMNNVHMYQAHKDEPIRGLSFAPTDVKLASASDDGTARIWDFARCSEERVLRGHGSEVRTVKWHPQKGLIVTGSRDSQQPVKLWDPKSPNCLATLQDHKSSVLAVEWNRNGNWLLTASRDHLIKLYDIRVMKEMHTYRGHKKEVTALAWHPIHEGLFVSGGGDGSLAYWLADQEKEVGLLEHAHDQAVWALEFHPLGHILASGSNDNNTKFWARNRPGDTQDDIFGLASFSNMVGALDKEAKSAAMQALAAAQAAVEKKNEKETTAPTKALLIPGMGLDDDVVTAMKKDDIRGSGGGGLLELPEDLNARQQNPNIGAKRTLIKQPPAKRAQRQFERMWNVSKPAGGGDDLDDQPPIEEEAGGFKRQKASLLGPPPTTVPMPSMLSPALPREPPPAPNYGGPPPRTAPPPMISPGGGLQWPPGMTGPPPGGLLPTPSGPLSAPRPYIKDESWTNRPSGGEQLNHGGDVDYRQMMSGPPPSQAPPPSAPTGDVDLRTPPLNTGWPPSGNSAAPLNDPRMRGKPAVPGGMAPPSGNIDFSEDVRDPRRRTNHPSNGAAGPGGQQTPQAWEGHQRFDQPPPFAQGGGFPGGGDFDARRGGGGMPHSFRGGPPRGGAGFSGGAMRGGPRGRGRGRGRGGPY